MPIYLQHGNLIDYVPPTDTSTEDVVFMGGLVGIPQAFIPAGELGALSVDGVYMFTKKDGVSVNLGDVVKYCGTTKLAQDSNADLTLGVAVADAEADSLGVKVKINSVLPTDGGGSGGEIAISCGLKFNEQGYLFVNVANGCGLDFDGCGALFATGGGGGGGDGLQNNATGQDALSILGAATTSVGSVSVGVGSTASGDGSTALGYGTTASEQYSIAIGFNAQASNRRSTAFGIRTTASGDGSTAFGYNAKASGINSNAFGSYTTATGNVSFAFGAGSIASGYASTALGSGAEARDNGLTVISAWDDSYEARTQLYLIGAGSTLSTTYCDGEAGLGFISQDGDGNVLKRGTIKLSALCTENTDTFEPS